MTTLLLGVVADDLSGAAECAAHAYLRVSRSEVILHPVAGRTPDGPVITIDSDSRRLGTADAAEAARQSAHVVAAAPVVVKKVDSALRGHVAVEVAALAEALERRPVVCVANPALDRVVRDGALLVHGAPLGQTGLWAVEGRPAPATVAEALAPLPTVLVPLATVTRGVAAVVEALVAARREGRVAVCDAVDDTHLDTVHAAAVLAAGRDGVLLVGSGALVDAAVRSLPLQAPPGAAAAGPSADLGDRSALFVLGTRATGLADQLAALAAAHTAHEVRLSPDRLLADPAGVTHELRTARERHAGARRLLAVTVDPDAPVDPTRSRALTESLARAVGPVVDAYGAAFLSGGETARAVLDRLGVDTLEVVGELGTGTVVSRRPGGALVVTRPGSFGNPASLVRVADHLLGATPSATPDASPDATPDAVTARAPGAGTRSSTDPAPPPAPPRPTTTRTTTGAPTEENP